MAAIAGGSRIIAALSRIGVLVNRHRIADREDARTACHSHMSLIGLPGTELPPSEDR
jgi:hypothetical protein